MASRLTSFEMLYELVDVEAASSSTLSAENIKDWGDLDLLEDEDSTYPDQMTLEHNFSVLDGGLPEFDTDTSDISFFADTMSNASGQWASGDEPTLDISFTGLHSSYAFTFHFINEEYREAEITWMMNSVIIVHGQYDLSGKEVTVREDVESYNRMIVKFNKAEPYRYIKMDGIYYGIKLLWDETWVKNGKLTKEISRISEKIPIDSLNFELVDTTFGDMNLGNQSGIWRFFQKNQPMYAYEYVNDDKIALGKFFLNTFSNDKGLAKMTAYSYMQLLDSNQFINGELYNGKKAGELLDQIFTENGIDDYEIDSVTYNQLLYGTLAPQTYRNAIKEILFACQSVIDTSDPEKVKVYKPDPYIYDTKSRGTKFSTVVSDTEYISQIEVVYATYLLEDEASNIVEGVFYPTGSHRVVLSNMCQTSSVTFSDSTYLTDIDINPYYIDFTCTEDVTLTISGKSYQKVDNSAIAKRELDPGQFEKSKSFNSTLCDYATALAVAQKVLKYYSNDRDIKIKALASDAVMDGSYLIQNSSSKYNDFVGFYTSKTLDLTGGFIEDSKFLGAFDTSNTNYYGRDTSDTEADIIMDDNKII